MAGTPSPGAFGADLSPPGRGDRARCSCSETLSPPREIFSDGAPHAVDLSPAGRGRERSERVRGIRRRGRLFPARNRDVVALRRTGIELPRAADLLLRI